MRQRLTRDEAWAIACTEVREVLACTDGFVYLCPQWTVKAGRTEFAFTTSALIRYGAIPAEAHPRDLNYWRLREGEGR